QDRWSNIGYEEYIQYRDRNRTISKLAISSTTAASIQAGGPPEAVTAMAVSGNYFESLRISAMVGRLISEADDKRGAPGAVVLGSAYWRHRFGSDPSIIGKTISVDGSPFTIVGVIPSSFNGTMAPFVPEVWIPWNSPHHSVLDRGTLIGRLLPEASIKPARADLQTIGAGIAKELGVHFFLTVSPARALHPEMAVPVTVFAGLLMALATLALLIACLNITSLSLARSTMRRREASIRIALGASRKQLVRQSLTESLILSSAGGAAAIALAIFISRTIHAISLPAPIPVVLELE